ncbi:MAG: DUF429 domain-containing protein [Saprospiraceae bacterium]|nr:DUF429 domain-containing protein [Bacteroidia bacterium]NNE16761.1 DUF429 domain-containing protein [Saprospiraceae bacterium]NNL92324.1 DUF429 domain-containing protein [Saprospiraceae bacterium]
MRWLGIDYGSKLAGSTAVAYLDGEELKIKQVEKKVDADDWLITLIKSLEVSHVFIDAPLSLPESYFNQKGDYFYRECDRQTKAMSPMFIGGLTARAIRLVSKFEDVEFIETYPSYLIKNVFEWGDIYNKKEKINDQIIQRMADKLPYKLESTILNYDQFDALACWLSGDRYKKGIALKFGLSEEGLITV